MTISDKFIAAFPAMAHNISDTSEYDETILQEFVRNISMLYVICYETLLHGTKSQW